MSVIYNMNINLSIPELIVIVFLLGMLVGSLLSFFYVISKKRYYVNFKTDSVPAFIDVEKEN